MPSELRRVLLDIIHGDIVVGGDKPIAYPAEHHMFDLRAELAWYNTCMDSIPRNSRDSRNSMIMHGMFNVFVPK